MAWHNEYREWLSESKSLENAQKVIDHLYTESKDWSKESIAGLLGNLRHESSINPNMYEYGYSWGADRGFGLVQWTPRSKFWSWGSQRGYSESQLRSGDSQLERIDYEVDNNIQYIPNGHNQRYGKETKYDFSFADFRSNKPDLSVNELVEAFMWNYEGPSYSAGQESLGSRQSFANKAYNELDWSGGGGGDNGDNGDGDDGDGEPDYDFGQIIDFFKSFGQDIIDQIEEMLKVNLYDYGQSKTMGNKFLKVDRNFSNIHKIKPTINFKEVTNDIIEAGLKTLEDLLGGIIPSPEPPEPDPDPDPDSDMYFPVNYNNEGINFWKRSNWNTGTIQKNMTYGQRSSGQFHSGYDIGSGGNTGYKVYAIRDCTITDIREVSGGGYSVFMEHETDKFHSLFLHLVQDSAVVSKGDKVKAGEQIAVMGDTGGNYDTHLHVEISPTGEFHTEGNTIDPEGYLKVTDDNKTELPSPE